MESLLRIELSRDANGVRYAPCLESCERSLGDDEDIVEVIVDTERSQIMKVHLPLRSRDGAAELCWLKLEIGVSNRRTLDLAIENANMTPAERGEYDANWRRYYDACARVLADATRKVVAHYMADRIFDVCVYEGAAKYVAFVAIEDALGTDTIEAPKRGNVYRMPLAALDAPTSSVASDEVTTPIFAAPRFEDLVLDDSPSIHSRRSSPPPPYSPERLTDAEFESDEVIWGSYGSSTPSTPRSYFEFSDMSTLTVDDSDDDVDAN